MTPLADGTLIADVQRGGVDYLSRSTDLGQTWSDVLQTGSYRMCTTHSIVELAGAVFFLLPGLVLAAGFSLAPPLVILEGISGRAALERSWRLLGGRWAQAFLFWALIVVFSVLGSAAAALLPAGPWRPAASTLIRVLLYPLPLTGLVLLYRDAAQYMRRTSAPG